MILLCDAEKGSCTKPRARFFRVTAVISESSVINISFHRVINRLSRADRLGHLVENVLAFAGLESGRARRDVERISVSDLVGRVRERLADRADQAPASSSDQSQIVR